MPWLVILLTMDARPWTLQLLVPNVRYEPILTATPHVGKTITDREQYCLVTLHPDTERYEKQRDDALTFFEAINDISLKSYCAVIWPTLMEGLIQYRRLLEECEKVGNCKTVAFIKI